MQSCTRPSGARWRPLAAPPPTRCRTASTRSEELEHMADVAVAAGTPQLTLEAADQIRDLIVRRVLLPGEKIRQVELANRVGVSRSPLREALRTLESEGIVSYEINRGYVVSRLDRHDLEQIYR